MATALSSVLASNETSFYSDPAFLVYLDDHVPMLRAQEGIETLRVEPTVALKYTSDFYGLLNHFNIPYPCHAAAIKINRIGNPCAPSRVNLEMILVPTASTLRRMYNTWKSHETVRK